MTPWKKRGGASGSYVKPPRAHDIPCQRSVCCVRSWCSLRNSRPIELGLKYIHVNWRRGTIYFCAGPANPRRKETANESSPYWNFFELRFSSKSRSNFCKWYQCSHDLTIPRSMVEGDISTINLIKNAFWSYDEADEATHEIIVSVMATLRVALDSMDWGNLASMAGLIEGLRVFFIPPRTLGVPSVEQPSIGHDETVTNAALSLISAFFVDKERPYGPTSLGRASRWSPALGWPLFDVFLENMSSLTLYAETLRERYKSGHSSPLVNCSPNSSSNFARGKACQIVRTQINSGGL